MSTPEEFCLSRTIQMFALLLLLLSYDSQDSSGYIFVADSMGLSSTTLT